MDRISARLRHAVLAAAAVAFALLIPALPGQAEKSGNPLLEAPPAKKASAAAKRLHAGLLIADMHADSLLWGRDLLRRSARGQVDIPRLAAGNVALQVFSVVTKSPIGQNIESNTGKSDAIRLLAVAQNWPKATRSSLEQRALYQAARLRTMASESNGRLSVIRTRGDLKSYLDRRGEQPNLVAALLSIEGAHSLDGDPANVDVMWDAGFRMMSLAHFFDNEFAGSAHGVDKGGLTDLGRDVVKRMEARHMIVDLAHASDKQIDDVLAMATRPVVMSHGGVKGTCNNRRNLSDDQLRGIAGTGGLVGIGFWYTATCGRDAASIARSIKYAADLIGIDHVALGSDFDGAVQTPFDAAEMVALTDALLKAGFSSEDIGKVMGGNEISFFMKNLPG